MHSFKIIFLTQLFLLFMAIPLFSHGAEYTQLSDRVMKFEVKYDTGEFFSESDVLVFPPNETVQAYSLKTDEKGIFYFQPDRAGDWVLQVRGENGHGMRINQTVDESMLSKGIKSNSLGLLQKLIMVLCVAWGTTGTVLYFRNRY